MQFIGELEAGGAGIVVDADRGAHCHAHRFEERVDLVLLQWLVGHRRQQQAGSAGSFGIPGHFQHVAGAQGADADDHRYAAGMGEGLAQHALALGFLQIGIAAGGAENAHRVHAGCGQALAQCGKSACVDVISTERSKRKRAEASKHGIPGSENETGCRWAAGVWTPGIVYCPRTKFKGCAAV
ncbi:hypothetical protein G6F46_013623 [Rhizopus delemar]|nr:hypothetical protein G6F46_013623 [Rhizopus delemar]